MDARYLEVVAELPGTKRLIMGNHDSWPCRLCNSITTNALTKVYDSLHGLVHYKNYWLSHAPIHPQELRGRVNIHGHTHVNFVKQVMWSEKDDPNYINVCVENTGFKPLNLTELINKRKEKSKL